MIFKIQNIPLKTSNLTFSNPVFLCDLCVGHIFSLSPQPVIKNVFRFTVPGSQFTVIKRGLVPIDLSAPLEMTCDTLFLHSKITNQND